MQLSAEGIQNLLNDTNKRPILQLLSLKQAGQGKPGSTLCYKGKLSDGFSQEKCYVAKDAAISIQSAAKANMIPIIQLEETVINKSGNKPTQIIVIKLKQIIEQINEIVGEPIDYKEFVNNGYTNQNGSRSIPQQYVNPQILQQNGGQPVQQNNGFQYHQQQTQQNQQQQAQQLITQQKFQPQPQVIQQNQQQIQQNTLGQQTIQRNFQKNIQQVQQQPYRTMNNAMINQQFGQNNLKKGPIAQIPQQQNNGATQQTKISELHPGRNNNWKILGRITKKKSISNYNKKNGSQGKLFGIDLIDKDNGEISCIFLDEAADKSYDQIQEQFIYEFKNGQLKEMQESKRKFNKPHKYTITFGVDASISLSVDQGDIPIGKFNFVKLNDVQKIDVNTEIDIVAIVKEVKQTQYVNSKNGELVKKSVILADDSGTGIELILWGKEANDNSIQQNRIICIKSARVGKFQNVKNISVSFNSQYYMDDFRIPECDQLNQWKIAQQQMGQEIQVEFQKPQEYNYPLLTIKQIEEQTHYLQGLNENDKSNRKFSTLFAHFTYVKSDGTLYYISCEKCQKKVEKVDDNPIDQQAPNYKCMSCRESRRSQARYITNIKISDSTGTLLVKIFGDQGQIIFGKTAENIREMKEKNEDEQIIKDTLEENKNKEFKITLLSKPDGFQGGNKVLHQIYKVDPPDNLKEGNNILNEVQKYI